MKLPALKEIIEERKDKAIEKLSDSYAKNRLPMEEYERLVEYINKIESERELVVVEKIVAEYGVDDGANYDGANYGAGISRDDDDYDDIDNYPRHDTNVMNNLSILSTRVFSGPVRSGAQFAAILGSAEIKIRKRDLGKRRTVLNTVAILGDCTIRVERGIRVINKAIPILGNAVVDRYAGGQGRDNEPEIVISGAALLGNITVKLLKD